MWHNSLRSTTSWRAFGWPGVNTLAGGTTPEAPAVWSVWTNNNTPISQFSPANMSGNFVTTPFMGGTGYIDLNLGRNRLLAGLIRQATFVVPTPIVNETDLLVTTVEHTGPILNGVNSVQVSVGSFNYQVPDASVPATYSSGFTQATGRIVNSVQAGVLRNTNWAGAGLQTATPGSTQQLQLLQMNSNLHTQDNLRIGPIYRVTSTPKSCIVLTFDDQGSEQYISLFPIMQNRNLVGNIFTDINSIGTGGARLTYANGLEMQAAGWCFALDSSSPVTSDGTIAQKLSWLSTTASTLLANGLGTPNTMKYLRYSWGSNSYPVNSIARSLVANGTNILTTTGVNASGIAQGAIIKGSVLDGGANVTVVRPVSDTQIEVSRNVASGTYPNGRICAIEANRTLTSDGSATVTNIDTRGITIGMLVVGTGITPGTTVVGIPTDSATGTLTLSTTVTGVTSASFYIAGSEWLPGRFMDAAFTAGFRAGFTVSAPGSGIYTGMGIHNMRNLMGISTFPWEGTAATAPSANTIFNLQQLIRNKRDVIPNHHWANSFAAVPADVTNAIATLDFIAARRDAGEIDVLTLDQWYNRVAARTPPI